MIDEAQIGEDPLGAFKSIPVIRFVPYEDGIDLYQDDKRIRLTHLQAEKLIGLLGLAYPQQREALYNAATKDLKNAPVYADVVKDVKP
jgi:hypothetical protein